MANLERRGFILGTCGSLLLGSRALAAQTAGEVLDLADPADAFMAMLRMQGRADGRDAPWWYFGRIYALVPGREPVPLVRFEGLEIMRLTPAGDGEYAATGVTTSFFQDFYTKAPLESFDNPLTGQRNAVQPNLLAGRGVAAWYSREGVRPGRVPRDQWRAEGLRLTWDQHADTVWLSHDRSYPPGLPQPMGEASVARARRADLHALAEDFVPAGFSSTYFAPYPRWMEMDGQAGHVVWHADGLKLRSVAELPAAFRERMEARFPERLAAPPYEPAAA